MDNVSKEMEILRKNQEKVLEIKSAVTKKKNAFNGLINGLDMTQERVSELEYVTIETSKTEKRLEGKPPQNKTKYLRIVKVIKIKGSPRNCHHQEEIQQMLINIMWKSDWDTGTEKGM